MTEQLFIGGPYAGQWRSVPKEWGTAMRYPKPVKPIVFEEGDKLSPIGTGIGRYVQRKYRHPSWRVMLRFWLDGSLTDLPLGAIMPGWQVGYGRRGSGARCPLRAGWPSLALQGFGELQAAWDELKRSRARWERNADEECWQLMLPDLDVPFGAVTFEFLVRVGMPRDAVQRLIVMRFGIPLPPEAW